MAVEETGPLKAGLLTAHPEDRGDAHHQHHQVLNEKEGDVRPARLLHLCSKGNSQELKIAKQRTNDPVTNDKRTNSYTNP